MGKAAVAPTDTWDNNSRFHFYILVASGAITSLNNQLKKEHLDAIQALLNQAKKCTAQSPALLQHWERVSFILIRMLSMVDTLESYAEACERLEYIIVVPADDAMLKKRGEIVDSVVRAMPMFPAENMQAARHFATVYRFLTCILDHSELPCDRVKIIEKSIESSFPPFHLLAGQIFVEALNASDKTVILRMKGPNVIKLIDNLTHSPLSQNAISLKLRDEVLSALLQKCNAISLILRPQVVGFWERWLQFRLKYLAVEKRSDLT